MSACISRSYFCIVNTPGAEGREIAVIAACDDQDAIDGLGRIGRLWPGFETITLYEGERIVRVLVNPALGFAPDPLDDWDRAA